MNVTPEGMLYAAERKGRVFQIARYVSRGNGKYAPEWKRTSHNVFYETMENEGAGHQEHHEFYPDGVIMFYSLDSQIEAMEEVAADLAELADYELSVDLARGQ